QTNQALERDGLRETIPIELPEKSRVAITASTAPILYNKGGSILRQLEGYIGKDSFREGLRNYLERHAYSCASSHQLWEAFEAVSEEPITRMMKSWIGQPGFPIVEVQRHGEKLILLQKRFTYLPNKSNQHWFIPLTIRFFYRGGDSSSVTTLLDGENKQIDIDTEAEAYKVNDGQIGFYRVKYLDRNDLNQLGKKVLNKTLRPEDRWGLQNDFYALVRQSEASIDEYLDFLSNYTNEEGFLPLTSIAGNLFEAFLVAEGSRRQKVASVGKSIFERVLTNIGLEPRSDERHTLSILRDRIAWHTVLYGSE
ncbi:MAG: hypothetical protein GTO24_25400, partial [candidate division Zixibacteria bacterium]|nr:hypothetical protein [candidate division Zixibacteria bacterium]